jgi:glycosyltransferase involved in cell wall biosynthesis
MNNLKICIYAISKNEEKFVKRFYESVKEADLVLLADTGSTDRTVELARECGIETYSISVSPWRFDIPRNTALSLVPGDFDICISLDLDEVMMPGWRQEIERLWIPGITTHMRYRYNWGNDLEFSYEKIHHRHGYQWRNMCHEVLIADPRIQERWVETDQLLTQHLPDSGKSRGQYMDLLEADVADNPHNERNALYYARELNFNNRWQDCISAVDRYLSMPAATWSHERSYALRYQGKSYQAIGQFGPAERSFERAHQEEPGIREPLVDLSALYQITHQWAKSLDAAERALEISHREYFYTADPAVWGSKPYDLAALASWHLGQKDQAVKYGLRAVELDPRDARLSANLEWYQGKKQ